MGKSGTITIAQNGTSGHPHVGGEICLYYQCSPPAHGPSPRGWGNQPAHGSRWHRSRAIPTWVGKSGRKSARGVIRSGHPHVGGEIQHEFNCDNGNHGPSPRGWGNLLNGAAQGTAKRAIPTWVGKSSHSSPDSMPGTGHPHVGGEIKTRLFQEVPSRGPSPRGWGNLPSMERRKLG